MGGSQQYITEGGRSTSMCVGGDSNGGDSVEEGFCVCIEGKGKQFVYI